MSTQNHITSSCTISNNTVQKNGHELFVNQGADVASFLLSIYQYLDPAYARFYKMDNLCKLGWLASEILLKEGFNRQKYLPEQIGLVLCNASSSLDTDIKYLETVKEIASPSVFVYTLPNIMIGEICIRNHFKGETGFFISEQFEGIFVEQYVSSLMNDGTLQACICGWVELLKNEYKAVLFLVEKKAGADSLYFNEENVNKIFHDENQVIK